MEGVLTIMLYLYSHLFHNPYVVKVGDARIFIDVPTGACNYAGYCGFHIEIWDECLARVQLWGVSKIEFHGGPFCYGS